MLWAPGVGPHGFSRRFLHPGAIIERFIDHRRGRTGIAAGILWLKSVPVIDKTYWANPLAPQPWHCSGGGAM